MKYLLISLLLSFVITLDESTASTPIRGKITFWPSWEKPIPANSIFIITLCGDAREEMPNLLKAGGLYLSHNREKVNLLVIELLIGDSNINQIVLRPENILKENCDYSLNFEGIKDDVGYMRSFLWNYSQRPLNWHTKTADFIQPYFGIRPTLTQKKFINHFYGFATFALFKNTATDENDIIYKITLKKDSGTTTFYIPPDFEDFGGSIALGTNGLFSHFNFSFNTRYNFTVQVIDVAGNNAYGEYPISFRSITKFRAAYSSLGHFIFPSLWPNHSYNHIYLGGFFFWLII